MEHADWFQGSADAVRKCFRHLGDPRIKYLLILSGDQLYRMDFSALFNFHIEKKSEITVACNPVDRKETPELGIMGIDKTSRIRTFIEKPKKSEEIEGMEIEVGGKEKFLASTGIYLFNKDVLAQLLLDQHKVDFGKEIIPDALVRAKTFAFLHEGYWKDIGSIESFYEENLAFTDAQPPLDFYDENWQFFTRSRFLPLSKIAESRIERSIIAEGAMIDKSRITHSIVGLRARIGADSVVEDSILMGNDYYDPAEAYAARHGAAQQPPLGIGRNCHLSKVIVDKNCRIGDNVKITNKKGLDEFENEFCVARHGIIIIPKDTVIPSGTVI
jgi:glucose-1-phosphate adenylyltransferase